MRHMDWSDLRVFLALARAGTVRGAAALLGVGHSTVARRLEALEAQAGVALVIRRPTGTELTDAGEEMRGTAERVETEVLELERRAFGRDRQQAGPVMLTMVDSLAVTPFLDVLHQFCVRHPQIDLRLHTGPERLDLDRREADLALRFGVQPADHLVGRRLIRTARAVYCSHDYAARHLADPEGTGAGWISFSIDPQGDGWKRTSPFPTLPTVLRCPDMRSQAEAAAAGFGFVRLACFHCDPDPRLLRVSEPEPVARQDLWLLRHGDTAENTRIRLLSNFLAAGLRGLKPLMMGETQPTVTPETLGR